MRTKSIIIGCVVFFALASGSSEARSDFVRAEFHFLRSQTDTNQFQQDLNHCKLASKHVDWPHQRGITGTHLVRLSVSASALQQCMTDRGYRLDPNGFTTGPMRVTI